MQDTAQHTVSDIKAFIKELKGQIKENKKEMCYHARGLSRDSYTEAAHLDSVNDCLDYVIAELQGIVNNHKSR